MQRILKGTTNHHQLDFLKCQSWTLYSFLCIPEFYLNPKLQLKLLDFHRLKLDKQMHLCTNYKPVIHTISNPSIIFCIALPRQPNCPGTHHVFQSGLVILLSPPPLTAVLSSVPVAFYCICSFRQIWRACGNPDHKHHTWPSLGTPLPIFFNTLTSPFELQVSLIYDFPKLVQWVEALAATPNHPPSTYRSTW